MSQVCFLLSSSNSKTAMKNLCDMQIHFNGQHTIFLNQEIMSKYSGRLKKTINQENQRTQIDKLLIEMESFPGDAEGFELVSRFCYNNGEIHLTVSNVSLLHCCAIHLAMTEENTNCNLLKQTEKFLEDMFRWSLNDLLMSLKSCEGFYSFADSYGLVGKFVSVLLAKISQNSDTINTSSSSSSSSPETGYVSVNRFSPSSRTTPETMNSFSSNKAWWFDDLSILPPKIIEKVIHGMGMFGAANKSDSTTRFLIHYLKTAAQSQCVTSKSKYSGLAETAVYGVVALGKKAFSCRRVFWVLRIMSGFGLSPACRFTLENLIGGMLDQATLDDLLVSAGHGKGVYDVNLVVRLIVCFVEDIEKPCLQKMKKVGRLIDNYLCEISADRNLKVSKFLAVAENLPDSARDCFDRVYRAVNIYLESHPILSFEERSKLCRCLNYEKLSLEVCKSLAKNPRVPPRISMAALISQQCRISTTAEDLTVESDMIMSQSDSPLSLQKNLKPESFLEEEEDMRLNLQRMQWRVVELEKLCRKMKGQMSMMIGNNVKGIHSRTNALPRLC